MSLLVSLIFVPSLLFVAGIVCIRFLGKKALAEMTGMEIFAIFFVNDIIIGPLIQTNVTKTVYYTFFMTGLYLLFTRMKNAFPWFHHLLVPSPTVLIRNGDILEDGLRKTKLSVEELLAMIRTKGLVSPGDVEMATLEEIGQLSILPKSNKRPLEPGDLLLPTTPTFVSIPLIMEGKIMDHNLKFLDLTKTWLKQQLTAAGYGNLDLSHITLAAYTQDGVLQIDTKKENPPQNKYSYMPGNDN